MEIKRGKTLGVVSESGCGKSVTARSILRIVPKPGRIVEGGITLYRTLEAEGKSCALTEEVKLTDLKPMGTEMRSIRVSGPNNTSVRTRSRRHPRMELGLVQK